MHSDIKSSVDIKKVLEERILNSRVELTLKEVLGIVKREFHEDIIDIIRRKRQVINEMKNKNVCMPEMENEDDYCVVGTNNVNAKDEDVVKSHYMRNHWARATTEVPIKLENLLEPCIAFIDQGSEVNLMSVEMYYRGNWPVDPTHGWQVKTATSDTSGFYGGACLNVLVTIGDV